MKKVRIEHDGKTYMVAQTQAYPITSRIDSEDERERARAVALLLRKGVVLGTEEAKATLAKEDAPRVTQGAVSTADIG